MTKLLLAHLTLLLLCVSVGSAANQALADTDIADAIALGQRVAAGEKSKAPYPWATCSAGLHDVTVKGNIGKIADLAFAAARRRLPFTAADVPPALTTEPAIWIDAEPDTPVRNLIAGGLIVPPTVEHVVITVAGVAQQPANLTSEPVQWGNAVGGQFTSNRASAKFVDVPATTGDVEVVLVTNDGDRKCRIKGRDWLRVAPRENP